MATGADGAKPKPRRRATKRLIAPKRAFGRSLADFTAYKHTDGQPLWPAERKLLEACRTGEMAWVAQSRPEEKTDDNTIRAGFLRFLILGGDDEAAVHERGVKVRGAWIEGALDLEGCRSERRVLCWDCRFSRDVILHDARLATLNLGGSEVSSIRGDRVEVAGGVFLRNGFKATGAVRFLGAMIGGTLDCSGGVLEAKEGAALSCDRMRVTGSVFLRQGFKATGAVRLLGAKIGGDLVCSGGVFEAKEGAALVCDGMSVKDAFLLRQTAQIAGTLNMNKARVGALVDDPACWPEPGKLILDGFTYDSFDGGAPTGAAQRADWLLRQREYMLDADFRPQPWTQAIKVLRAMGHARDARALAIRFEEQRRKAEKYPGLARPLHWLYGALAGYGYRPLRLLGCMAVCWALCAVIYKNAGERGVMAPANPLVFDAPAYQATCRPRAGSEAHWLHGACKGPNEYTAFSPWLYSLDLILPLVDLQQDKDWAPMVTRDAPAGSASATEVLPLGVFTRAVMWFEILFGWVISLLFVAILSGLVKKSEEE